MRDPSLLYHYLAVDSRVERLLSESKSEVLPLNESTVYQLLSPLRISLNISDCFFLSPT